MKEWLIDTNVLLDVLGADSHFGERLKAALVACATTRVLVINPVIFGKQPSSPEGRSAVINRQEVVNVECSLIF